MNRLFDWTYRALGLVPFLWVIAVVVFHFCAVKAIGYPPGYDDPQSLNNPAIWSLGSYIVLFFFISVYCSFLFVALILINFVLRFFKKAKINYVNILISTISV